MNERTGIVEEGLRRAAVYGRFVDRRVRRVMSEDHIRMMLGDIIDKRIRVEIEAITARRLEKLEREMAALDPNPGLPLVEILTPIIGVTGHSIAEIMGPRRHGSVSAARHFGFWIVRRLRPDLSLPTIARIFNKADHTTVMHGVRRIDKEWQTAPFKDWFTHPTIVALLGARGPR